MPAFTRSTPRAVATLLAAIVLAGGCATAAPPGPSAAASAAAVAPMSKEDMRAYLARIATDRAAMEQLMAARFPLLTGRKRELIVDQSAAMFGSPAFADRVYETIAPKLQGRSAAAPGAQVAFQMEIREQAAALGQQLTLKGMTRLPSADQERFVRHAIRLHRSVDAATCRALIDGKLPALRMQQVEIEHNASLADAEFEQALALNRRAIQAELAGAPPVPQLTPAQSDAAQKAWGRAILARGKVPGAQARFDRVRTDRAKATDAETCWTTLQYLEALLDLRGNERRWQLHSYMIDTASE